LKTHENEIMKNTTLAPPPERLTEAFYNPTNLSQKDAVLLGTISKNLVTNTDSVISALNAMMSNLKMYKEVMIDSINAESEGIDLEMKYSKSPPQQSHSLPGVITLPPSYDLQAVKKDNARFEEVKEVREKVNKQRDLYIKLLQQEYKMFSQAFRRMLYNDSTFATFTDSLESKI